MVGCEWCGAQRVRSAAGVWCRGGCALPLCEVRRRRGGMPQPTQVGGRWSRTCVCVARRKERRTETRFR